MLEGHEMDIKDGWMKERFGAFLSIQPHIDSKKNHLTPKKLFTFPWEEKEEPFKASIESKEKAKKWRQIIESGKLKPKENGKSKNRS